MFPLISEAHAQAADGVAGLGASPIAQFLPLVLIMVVFYFLMYRPQQQEQKKLKDRLGALRKGDRILTAGGIVGLVTKAREGAPELEVEIAPNVRVTVMRDTVSNVLSDQPATPAATTQSKA